MARSDTRSKRFPSGFLVAALLVASGLMWAVMFFGSLAHLTRLAEGMTPFDIRPWATVTPKRKRLLKAIGEQGRAYYAGPELRYVVADNAGGIRKTPLPLKVRWALIAVPILVASLDVIENGCIAVAMAVVRSLEGPRRGLQPRHPDEDHGGSSN